MWHHAAMMRARIVVPLVIGVVLSCSGTAHAQPPSTDATITPPQAFRLGTAARPFGWSTAIGDLNADGRPDAAITDRVGRVGSGFAYSLELKLAGVGSRSLTFDAPDDVLAVALLDIDHDHDLDVVVSTPLSRAVVRVWLNDGQGGFHEAALPRWSGELRDELVDGGVPCAPEARAIVQEPRWQHAARTGERRPSAPTLAGNRRSARQLVAPRAAPPSPLQSRAPPRV
jgi:hypothetical protein